MIETNMKSRTIILETRRWGRLEIDSGEVLYFRRGIPGFDAAKRFAIFQSAGIEPFQWLISIDQPELGFVIVQPYVFYANYNPKLFEADLRDLDVAPSDKLAMFAIVTLAANPLDSTANLQGPLLINLTRRAGKQIVVVDDEYSVKQPILAVQRKEVRRRQFEPVAY